MIFLEMFVAFAATMAFAVIFNVSRSELIFCGIAGLVAEGVYLFTLRISGLFDFGNNIACTRCGYV